MARQRKQFETESRSESDVTRGIAPGRVPSTSGARSSGAVQRTTTPTPGSGRAVQCRDDGYWTHHPMMGGALLGVGPVQAKGGADARDTETVHEAASAGVQGSGGQLPHLDAIQRSFGNDHDLGGVQAYVGGAAAEASESIGASAYATGDKVAFKAAPDLHTAAHEAAHVVQQQQGVSLEGGVGKVGDSYENHADAVADRVVAGESAADLLGQGSGGGNAVQARSSEDAPVQGDWLGAGLGGLGGAAAGAGIGAAVGGPIGAVVGGAIGAAAGAAGGYLAEEAMGSNNTVLADDTATKVEKAITEGRKQDAVDAVVTDLAGQGRIDTSLLLNGKMTYDSSVGGEGVANPPGYDGSSGDALPTDVRIGDAAFANGVTLLHTSIMHEYWHVEQFQEAGSSSSVVPGQGGGSLIDQQEVEAYCWEIEHAEDTGLGSNPTLMEDAWNRLHNNYWVNLAAAERTPLTAQVTRCHGIAERVTGKTLVFNK